MVLMYQGCDDPLTPYLALILLMVLSLSPIHDVSKNGNAKPAVKNIQAQKLTGSIWGLILAISRRAAISLMDTSIVMSILFSIAFPRLFALGRRLGDSRNPTHRSTKCWVTLSLTQPTSIQQNSS